MRITANSLVLVSQRLSIRSTCASVGALRGREASAENGSGAPVDGSTAHSSPSSTAEPASARHAGTAASRSGNVPLSAATLLELFTKKI